MDGVMTFSCYAGHSRPDVEINKKIEDWLKERRAANKSIEITEVRITSTEIAGGGFVMLAIQYRETWL